MLSMCKTFVNLDTLRVPDLWQRRRCGCNAPVWPLRWRVRGLGDAPNDSEPSLVDLMGFKHDKTTTLFILCLLWGPKIWNFLPWCIGETSRSNHCWLWQTSEDFGLHRYHTFCVNLDAVPEGDWYCWRPTDGADSAKCIFWSSFQRFQSHVTSKARCLTYKNRFRCDQLEDSRPQRPPSWEPDSFFVTINPKKRAVQKHRNQQKMYKNIKVRSLWLRNNTVLIYTYTVQ